MPRTSVGEVLPSHRFQLSGRSRHEPVDQAVRADVREVDTNVMVDSTGWRHDEDDVEIAGQALHARCSIIVIDLEFGSPHVEFYYLDLVR
jgi:hypothetical protein